MGTDQWRDDETIARHKRIMTNEAYFRKQAAVKPTVSEYRKQQIIARMFDTARAEVVAAPDTQIGLGDLPNPCKGIAPLTPEQVVSRAVETRRVKEFKQRAFGERLALWAKGNNKPTPAHELKFGTQRGFGTSRTGLCVCGAEMYAVEYDGELEMTCPNETASQ